MIGSQPIGSYPIAAWIPQLTAQVYTLDVGTGSFDVNGQSTNLNHTFTIIVNSGSFALSGQNASLFHDSILTLNNGSFALVGQDVVLTKVASNTLAATTGTFTLSGQSLGLLYNRGIQTYPDSIGSSFFVVTGQSVTLTLSTLFDTGLFVLTGQNVLLQSNRKITPTNGSFTFTGQSITLTYSGQVIPRSSYYYWMTSNGQLQ
jgi:hypothetical protein